MTKINGIIPIMPAPLTEAGAIDEVSVNNIISFYIEKGVEALWLLGSAGEELSLSRRQTKDLIKSVEKSSNSQIKIITGSGLNNVDDALDFSRELSNLKLDGFHFLYRDAKQGEKLVIKNILRLADGCPFPLWLYNNVKRGATLTRSVIRAVKNHPNIHGVKYGSFNHGPFLEVCTEQTENFQVVTAGNFLLSMLVYGGSASTNSDSNYLFEEYNEIIKLFNQGKLEEAREQQFKLVRLTSELPKDNNGENTARVKFGMSLRGLCSDSMSNSYETLNQYQKSQMIDVLKKYSISWIK
ncbi:dihydrodipicolinate synthase family protein [Alphaproteobacteria bacterium]|nr:dihydrodipicolinate synthase family protein [Alphaproteobacteria bacterium]